MDADDYSELIRFWLQLRTGEEGSITTKLADRLGVTPTAVGYWVRGERNIPDLHWRDIAKHFGFPREGDRSPLDALIADARRLWAIPENRSYYNLNGRSVASERKRKPPERHRRPRRMAAG